MDFFEAQARAHKKTRRLILLFVAGIAATILSMYLLLLVAVQRGPATAAGFLNKSTHRSYERTEEEPLSLWDPELLAWVAGGTLVLVGGAALFKTAQLARGGPAVAAMVGGRRVDPHTTDLKEKRLLNVVEEMAIASGIPAPEVYVLDDEQGLNAFAAGLTPSDAVVAVTRGTLERLNRDELQGVVAHEFSHILNGDMRMNIRLLALLFGIFFLTLVGRGLLRFVRFAGSGRGKRDGRLVLFFIVLGLVMLVVGSISYFFGRLIQAAVSREREFLADASAVQFTRNPGGIVGALKKIGGASMGSRVDSSRAAAIGHFFFAEGLTSNFLGLFATHPPLDVRIRAIDPTFDGKFAESLPITQPEQQPLAASNFSRPVLTARPTAPSKTFAPEAALASIGTLTPYQVENAQSLLTELPERLRTAARLPEEAPALVYALLLDARPEAQLHQISLLPREAAGVIAALSEPLNRVTEAHKLPLCQLAIPALRAMPDSALADFFATLKLLAEADGRVTVFEFALQKVLYRQLLLSRTPKLSLGDQVYSFQAMREPIIAVLSAMAHASTTDAATAAKAYAAALSQLRSLEGNPPLLPPAACGPAQLGPYLDQLAIAAGPIKQRLLLACARIVNFDGQVRVSEAELLRAVAACLDCPVPPLV